ncbi:xaa-Pro aminopeptidase 3-like [Oppia nitens]|uniref:xaa-Pro aminopeptidase 3-like n=1 Tax=Oppia nitens TaxID=1686743 RepID=UPI0023DAE041|nr:xaa-Pro aminopeptidase 3-like [Oppia nitens]
MINLFAKRLLLSVQSPHELAKHLMSSSTTFSQFSPEISTILKSTAVECPAEDQNSVPQLTPISAMSSLITSEEIRERHQNLMKLIDKNSYVGHKPSIILVSASSRPHLADTRIPCTHFKQNSDFIYLTGLTTSQSADCVLALIGGHGEPLESIMFAPFGEQMKQLWDGSDLREQSPWINSICNDFRDISKLKDLMSTHSPSRQLFVSKSGFNQTNGNTNSSESCDKLNPILRNLLNLNSKTAILKMSPLLEQLRLSKSKAECNAMRRVCSIGSLAMANTMGWTNSLSQNTIVNEAHIAAKFEFECRFNGARNISFPIVCGSGQRSTIIHYGNNNQFCSPNDWVMIDGGCEDVDGYNSDITRSWPINGDFGVSRLRRDLHEALCEVQSELISAVSNDSMMTLDLLFKLMCTLLSKVLLDFNAFNITVSPQEAISLAYRLCPHHVSHYLGLDVHDCPSIPRNFTLKPGYCFTVEPGLYFHKSHAMIKPEFQGIGMRVEDDVLMNHSGRVEILTTGCPHKPNLI